MKLSTSLFVVLNSLVVLGGCASVPKAPTVSASHRKPINGQDSVALQSCMSDLHNTKLMLNEASRLTQGSGLCGTQKSLLQPPATVTPSKPITLDNNDGAVQTRTPNSIYFLRFPYASSSINLTEESAITLSEATKSATLIVVRGRTDGVKDTTGEAHVARARANAVRDYLVAQGIEPGRIRVSYQAVGDYVAENNSEAGRALNRRAEVEVYYAAPIQQTLAQAGL